MDYGTENRTFLLDTIVPLLENYSVLAYIAGHDHNLQYARPNKVSYFVSGAGSRLRDGLVFPSKQKSFFLMMNGFLACSINREGILKVAAIDMTGKMIDNAIAIPFGRR